MKKKCKCGLSLKEIGSYYIGEEKRAIYYACPHFSDNSTTHEIITKKERKQYGKNKH